MGKRARRAGVTNAMVKAAARTMGEHEARAMQIAGDIFNIGMEQAPDGDPLPLELRAPMTYVGIRCTPYMLQRAGLEHTPENEADAIAYLTEGAMSIFVEFDPDHFAKWRTQQNELAGLLGMCAHCKLPGVQHREDEHGVRWCADGTLAALPEFKIDDEIQTGTDATENPYEDELLRDAWDHGRQWGKAGNPSVMKLEDLPEHLRAVAKPGLAQAWQVGWAVGIEENRS